MSDGTGDNALPARRSCSVVVLVVGAAATVGLVAGLLVFTPLAGRSHTPEYEHSTEPETTRSEPETPRDTETVLKEIAVGGATVVERFDSADPDVRHATAYALLVRGSEALAQVSALRPTRPEAQDLRRRLEGAIVHWERLLGSTHYGNLPETSRRLVRLETFSKALPPEWLRAERFAYWSAKVEKDVARSASKRPPPEGEAAFARLALARVRWERKEIDLDAWRAVREQETHRVRRWLGTLRTSPGVSPAQARAKEEHLARLLR